MHKIKTILVIGKTGQLSQAIHALIDVFPNLCFTFVSRQDMDLSDSKSIEQYFENHQYDLIINCAAYTAVDKAESEVDLANQVNHLAVVQLASIAKRDNSKLIHISTDYVFDGMSFQPYKEIDEVAPQSVYGKSKLAGEIAIRSMMPVNALIIRTSWVYSEFGANFVKTMLHLGKERQFLKIVYDQVGSPTYARDLAMAILNIAKSDIFNKNTFDTDVLHFSNEGVCTWYDFAKTIFEIENIDCIIKPIESIEYPTPAKRPHFSLLNKAKIKDKYDIEIPYWKDSLTECLRNLEN
jgi:dTDP-4-dehydrorhamnose reductase